MCGSREWDRIRIDNVFEAKDRTIRIAKKVYLKIGSNMLPQRKTFGCKETKIFLYGNKTAVGRRSQAAGRTTSDVVGLSAETRKSVGGWSLVVGGIIREIKDIKNIRRWKRNRRQITEYRLQM